MMKFGFIRFNLFIIVVRGVTLSGTKAHSNVLIQTVYYGTKCNPINLFYPPGYTPGKSLLGTGSPSFRPSKVPTTVKPTKPQPSMKPTVSSAPSKKPITSRPSKPVPTVKPTKSPSSKPTKYHSQTPVSDPTSQPIVDTSTTGTSTIEPTASASA